MKAVPHSLRRKLFAKTGLALIMGMVVSLTAPPAFGEASTNEPTRVNETPLSPDPDAPPLYLTGDFNLNGVIDLDDVTACAMAWQDREAYFQTYPQADEDVLNTVGDFTDDGMFDTRDIDPYKTFVVAELTAQQEKAQQAQQQEEQAEAFRPTSSVVWVNDTLPESTDETTDAEPDAKDITDAEAPPVTDMIVDPSFTRLPPARSSKGESSGGQVISAKGNGGGGGGGGGMSLGGGGGGGGGSGGGGSAGSSGGGSSGASNGRVSVVGGGTTGVIVAGSGSTNGGNSTGGSYSSSGGQSRVELRSPGAAVAPIEHEPNYRGEAALFGYAPFYEPNPVAFDPDNKPYIRVAGNVQTQGPNGNWVNLSINDSITRYYQSQRINRSFTIKGGLFLDERITFDSRGDAYTIAWVVSGKNSWWFLLHSRDNCVTWDVYPLPASDHIRIEFNDGHNTLTEPPAVLLREDKYLGVVLPRRNANGSLTMTDAVTISNDALFVSNHSGGSNTVISVDDQVFVVYSLASKWQLLDGTSQFVMALDRATGNVTTPQTLLRNVGTGEPDAHYLPAITADSQGYLHAVLGAHHDSLYYLKSQSPLDASSWSTPAAIGKTVELESGGHTYPSVACDVNDQLHVVTRWAGDKDYKFRLSYNTGDAQTGTWAEQKPLVSPFRAYYSIWYHHLSMDREGRLFLNYLYFGNQLNAEHLAAYKQIWPEDGIPSSARPYPEQDTIEQIKAHDPAMLFTDNAGEDWRLTTSPDLFTED